jgi:hypothetical protein
MHATRSPHRRPTVIAVLVLVLGATVLASACFPGTAMADEGLRVDRNEASYTFAESISFDLTAHGSAAIDDIVLRFTVGGEGPINRRIPTFTPGTDVQARQHEDLVRGQVPPGAEITWWWTLTDSTGTVHETPRKSVRYLDRKFDWRSTAGPDVRVWSYGGDTAQAETIADKARATIRDLEPEIGAIPDRTIEIVVYASQEDLRPALAARGSTYEERLATLGARVAPDILVLDAGTRSEDLGEVLAHELTHLVLHLRFGHEYLDTVQWLDEGLAMYSEGPLAASEQQMLDAAVKYDELMSVRSLTSFPGEADLVPLAYAQSRDLVAFLIDTYGTARFRQLIDAVSTGMQVMDDALQAVYGFDQGGLYQAYRAHYGLTPAATPAPGAPPPARIARRSTAPSGPCGTVLLVLPALAAAWLRRRA